ncbi:hypothetical protein P3T27_005570 [Kitasatospora sp. MAA19]|uniref:helix-turn-helix domain-containing protein n=1 Tax=Kitasatospora sp. MAA19 TaxID=3035090 RepID=UPI0024771AFE|nr:helix-turn-helix domain-containing protein [Kitasatospora sp. MAA19]MDH6708824.1 hypothetical protein [Kitasatospora sp. MAA19]
MVRHLASGNTPPAPADQLASELQALKSGSGLTYVRISERTHYAKSSWERWVNGKQFPPRDAVERIAGLCEGDAAHLLDLWNLADACRAAGGAPDRTAPVGPAGAVRSEDRDRDRQQVAVLWSLASLVLILTAGLVLTTADRRTFRRSS